MAQPSCPQAGLQARDEEQLPTHHHASVDRNPPDISILPPPSPASPQVGLLARDEAQLRDMLLEGAAAQQAAGGGAGVEDTAAAAGVAERILRDQRNYEITRALIRCSVSPLVRSLDPRGQWAGGVRPPVRTSCCSPKHPPQTTTTHPPTPPTRTRPTEPPV